MRERIVFSVNGAKTTVCLCGGKKMNLESYLTTSTKINYKWIIDLNAKAKTIKLKKNWRKICVNLVRSSDFLRYKNRILPKLKTYVLQNTVKKMKK